MRTTILCILFVALCCRCLYGQNLVQNPSFENLIQCPTTYGQIDYADGWFIANGTPDLFSSCTGNNLIGMPNNARGNQLSIDGQTYSFIITYWKPNNDDYREIIGSELSQALMPGQKYYYSFFVSLADVAGFSCITNKLGIKFSTVLYNILNPISIDNTPSVFNNQLISNQDIWTCISGNFIADSAYSYLYIGNLFDDFNTDTLNCQIPQSISGYFLDQICLSTDSLTCDLYTSIPFLINNDAFTLVSSVVNDEINIVIKNTIFGHLQFQIWEAMGKIVEYGEIEVQSPMNILVDDLSPGIYYLKLKYKNYVNNFKFLKL